MSGSKVKTNYANSLTIILLVAVLTNLAFYWLPDAVLGVPIKKVDLLSDIRMSGRGDDWLLSFIPNEGEDEGGADEGQEEFGLADSAAVAPVPLLKPILDDNNPTNYLTNKNIEDFSSEHSGLQRFFSALDRINTLGRPVRIAFLGDSFIEGDIIVADFRAKMQERFGGRGVGFVPITSVTAQYRATIKQSADGWKSYSLITNKERKYELSGGQFEPESENASFQFKTVNLLPGLKETSTLKIIYSHNIATELYVENSSDTLVYALPSTEDLTQFELHGSFTEGQIQFKHAEGLVATGIAFEDNRGVVVDNFSLRGNSGMIMSQLDVKSCRLLRKIRPYDLLVLQYGLNVVNDTVFDYSWYRNRMITVIDHIKTCFPESDILILGVSDRSKKEGNSYTTMPAVVSLLYAQRQIAQRTGTTFWSMFAAMGGQNSMVKYVDAKWASSDYTHLSFRGGREVANELFHAIITEKALYDEQKRQFTQDQEL